MIYELSMYLFRLKNHQLNKNISKVYLVQVYLFAIYDSFVEDFNYEIKF